jgi:hypothetical protein
MFLNTSFVKWSPRTELNNSDKAQCTKWICPNKRWVQPNINITFIKLKSILPLLAATISSAVTVTAYAPHKWKEIHPAEWRILHKYVRKTIIPCSTIFGAHLWVSIIVENKTES